MKNAIARANEASNEARRRKRPRIGEGKIKEPTAEERERAKARALLKVDQSVWAIINAHKQAAAKHDLQLFGDPLEMPFKSEHERVRFYSNKFRNVSIPEAFNQAYSLDLADEILSVPDVVPTELRVGDMINLTIASISKQHGVVFNVGAHKENIITRNNLAKYPELIQNVPDQPLTARVIETNAKNTVVDIFGPMVEEFILPRTAEPWIQNAVDSNKIVPVLVRNLHLVRGGFVGRAVIPNASQFCGDDYEVDAFIPGSHIALNSTDRFDEFEGQAVQAFIMGWTPKPSGSGMSLICSVKNFLRHMGNTNLIHIHKAWCDAGEAWNSILEHKMTGRVTGVINSTRKCGVFVEVPYLNITGLVPMPADKLCDYPANKWVDVRFKNLEEDLVYNEGVDQHQHLPAFEIERGAIKKVNIKPILEFV